MFELMDRLNHKINEHLRSTSFEEKSALNISGKFECTYEWISAYFDKYRKKEHFWKCQFLVKHAMIKSLNTSKKFTQSDQLDLKIWQNACCENELKS